MLFALKKTLSALLLPPVSCIVLALLGLWIARWHRRTGVAVMVGALLSVLLLSWPPVSDALVRSLERYPAVTPEQLSQSRTQAIVVLGGGADTVAHEYGADVLSRGARERVRYAVYLQQQAGLPILATGGSTGGMRAEAQIMKEVVEQEFKGRVRWTEGESLDTLRNAENSAALLKAAGIERIALVTHGWHMVRAANAFERAGLRVLPAPMGFNGGKARRLYRVLPRASALADSSLALHEWLGILAQQSSLVQRI